MDDLSGRLQKDPPARDAAYLAWVHERQAGAPCCVCMDEPWTELHHFGAGGGMGRKPSDYLVCRVCTRCHGRYGFKAGRQVWWANHWEDQGERLIVLAQMQRDALSLLDRYLRHRPAARPGLADLRRALAGEGATQCAVAELQAWLCTQADGATTPASMADWLLRWADRRAAELIDAYGGDGHGGA